MTAQVLVDTDIWMDLFNGDSRAALVLKDFKPQRLAISLLSYLDLSDQIKDKNRLKMFEFLMARVTVLGLESSLVTTAQAMMQSGQLQRDDALQVALAVRHKLILLTTKKILAPKTAGIIRFAY